MLYAETSRVRTRQILGDLLMLAWVVVWVWAGSALHGLVSLLAVPGERVEDAGRDLEGAASGGGERVGELPLVGDVLRAPFDAVAEGGRALVEAGSAQQDTVASLALWLGLLAAGLPIAVVLLPYLWRRLRRSREADAAALLRAAPEGRRLLAQRALARAELTDLAAAYRASTEEHRPDERLATVELERLGLRGGPPTSARPAPSAERRDRSAGNRHM